MIRAYHFLFGDMRCDEDLIAGNVQPWRVGETRRYREVRINAGQFVIIQLGYHSSPTLWSALLNADGPVACLVEVSEPHLTQRTGGGWLQISRERSLLEARDLSTELRLFACDCASRVLPLYERYHHGVRGPRKAIESARRFVAGSGSQGELSAALRSAREAAEAATGKARSAAWAATATAFDDASAAATAAAWFSRWAAGKMERHWQRSRFALLGRALFQP
jgi:Imm-5 like putative immunity protein